MAEGCKLQMQFIIGTAVKLASGSIRSGALLLALASALESGAATTYISDPLNDGSWSNTSGGDGLGAVWYAGSAGTLSITNDATGIGSGNALRLAGSATGQKCLAQFHPTTLTDPGDWVRLSLDFRFETAPPVSVWAGLRVGLCNTYLTRTTADGASANRNNDKGYGGFISSPGAAGANAGVFSEAPGDDILGGSVGPIAIGSAGDSPNCGTSKHTFTILLSRQANGDLAISAQVDALAAATGIVAAATSPTYSFDSVGVGEGTMAVPLIIDNVSVTGSQADDFDRLRLKWLVQQTGGTNYSLSDSQVQSKLSGIASTANSYWNSMDKSPGRTYLWSTLTSTTVSSQISSMAGRFREMALGYATYGCSLYHNATLGADLVSAMDWFYTNRYNENMGPYDNWWDFEIGAPMSLQDAYVMVFDRLTPTQVGNYARATAHFTPTPAYTGANLMWKARVVGVRGVMTKNYAELRDTRDCMSQLFPYVTTGDGFYTDGSFIQHDRHPYTGGYGMQVIGNAGPMLQWLQSSAGEVLDPAQTNFFNWVYDTYAPLVYRGGVMDMVRGREISRPTTDHSAGLFLVDCIFRVSQFAPPADAARMQALVKYWGSVDTTANYSTYGDLSIYPALHRLMTNTSIAAAPEPVFHKQFWGMDRVVHTRPGWGIGLSCSSSRVYDFESCCGGENLHAWFTAQGMTCLQNSDLTQFTDGFWPTVDPYRLPGTTVDTTARTDGGGNYLSPAKWVGGASLAGTYGAAGMELDAANSSLTAKKSWFMFDNEVVCLGASITCSGVNPVETTVENRRLNSSGNNAFTVNGVTMPATLGWSSNLTSVSWCALNGAGGYYFPAPVSANVVRQARTGSWHDINLNGSTTAITRNYLTLWLNHGTQPANATYSYVLLPNLASSAVSQYAANPEVSILANSATIQAVRESTLGIVAANFWVDGNQTADLITVNKKASVITRASPTTFEVGVADPTQTNTGSILVTFNRSATSLLSADSGVTVLQITPQIQLSVNVSSARGWTRHASFSITGGAVPSGPTDLTAFPAATQVTLSWGASAGATSYWVKRSLVSGGPYTSIATNASTCFTNTGLAQAATYYYVVSAVNTNGQSVNSAEVSTGGVPANGRALWLRADMGVTLNGSTVSQWADQSGNNRHATQATAANQPALVASALNGKSVLRFDGANDFLNFNLPINGLTGLTIVLVSANSASRDPGINQGDYAPIFWEETADWGWTYLSPFQTNVTMRFGTTQTGNLFKYPRPSSISSSFTTTVGMHDQATDSLYVNGNLVMSAGSKLSTIAATVNTPYLGRGGDNTYFPGDIAEVLVYSNALSATDRVSLENYLRAAYLPGQLPAVAITSPTNGATFTAPTNVSLEVTAGGGSGAISQVAFFANETLLGQDASAPYSLTWSNVAPGSYSLRARAIDNAGAAMLSEPILVTVSAALTPPAAPTALVAAAVSTNQINLLWSDNASNETGYALERKTGSGTFAQVAALGTNATSYSDTGLAANTRYYYRVYATNSAGASAASNEADATTPATPILPPVLSPVANQGLIAGADLSLANHAEDPNTPPRALRFSLPQAPPGAGINEASGIITWRPAIALSGTSNLFTVVVSQEGGGQTTLAPVADAHVIESYPNANYGSQANLMVKLSATPGLTRESFLRFDVSGVFGTISNASLRLMPTVASSPGTHALGLVTNNGWGETTLTWANKPPSSTVLATWVPQEGVAAPVPLTSAVQDAHLQDGLLSLRLYATNSTADGLVYYGSKEGIAQDAPQLIVTSVSPSLSATQSFWVVVNAPVCPALSLAGMDTNGHFRLTISGDAGPDYTLQASTNLLDWTTLLTTNQPALPFQFVDPDAAIYADRFYRALLGP